MTPMFSSGMSASGSMTDLSAGDFCMNLPETIIQPRPTNTSSQEIMDADTYDEDFERMRGHVRRESGYRERNEVDGMGNRFVAKKMLFEK